jgi:hypothetical protein
MSSQFEDVNLSEKFSAEIEFLKNRSQTVTTLMDPLPILRLFVTIYVGFKIDVIIDNLMLTIDNYR